MTNDYIDFFLRFPNAEAALQAAQALGFAGSDATELPKDGWWHDEDGQPVAYYAIDVLFGTGELWLNNGTDDNPELEQIPGFHINGRWFGSAETVPDFGEALVMPTQPACRFA